MSDLVRREDVLRVIEDVLNWPDTFHREMLNNAKARIWEIPEAKLRFAEVYDDIGVIKEKLDELREWI